MIRISIFFLAWIISFSTAEQNLCFATDHCLFCNYAQVLSLENNYGQKYLYDDFVQASVVDLYSFSCIINAALLDNGTVLFLDNKMNELQMMNLHHLGIYSPEQIAVEDINFFWIYDSFTNTLYRINRKLEQINYRMSLDYFTTGIKNMIFADNRLYFFCKQGIFSIDNLFSIHHEGVFRGATDFYVYSGHFFVLAPDGIYYQDSLTYPVDGITDICGVFSDSLVVIRQGQVRLFPMP